MYWKLYNIKCPLGKNWRFVITTDTARSIIRITIASWPTMDTSSRGPQVEGSGVLCTVRYCLAVKNAVRTHKNNQWHHGSNTLKWPLFTSFMSWVPPLSDFAWRRDCSLSASKPQGLSLPSFRISGFKILFDVKHTNHLKKKF